MITITLDQIRACYPCVNGWARIVKARTRNGVVDYYEAFPLAEGLDSNGLDDTIWALRCIPNGRAIAAKFAAFCAKQAAAAAANAAAFAAVAVDIREEQVVELRRLLTENEV